MSELESLSGYSGSQSNEAQKFWRKALRPYQVPHADREMLYKLLREI